MFFLWLLLGIAFMASALHLGSPLRAMNSLNRIGASGLSNEILCGSLFFAAGGLYWLLAVLGKMPVVLGRLWLMLTMAMALLFVWGMSQVYQINTVPTWYSGYTTLSFFVTMLIGGPLLGYLLLRSVEMESASLYLLPLISCFAALVGVVSAGMQGVVWPLSTARCSRPMPWFRILPVRWRCAACCWRLGWAAGCVRCCAAGHRRR